VGTARSLHHHRPHPPPPIIIIHSHIPSFPPSFPITHHALQLIKDGFVIKKPQVVHSRSRFLARLEAKRKGRHTGMMADHTQKEREGGREGGRGVCFVIRTNHRQWEGLLPSLCPFPLRGGGPRAGEAAPFFPLFARGGCGEGVSPAKRRHEKEALHRAWWHFFKTPTAALY